MIVISLLINAISFVSDALNHKINLDSTNIFYVYISCLIYPIFKVNKKIMSDLSQKNKQNLLCIDEKDGKKITLNMNKKGWLA